MISIVVLMIMMLSKMVIMMMNIILVFETMTVMSITMFKTFKNTNSRLG